MFIMSDAAFCEVYMNMENVLFGALVIWCIIAIVQFFLGFGTAYRCTKKGRDTGVGLFIYVIGFSLAALVPGLGLHYYIKHLQPKVIVKQQVLSQPTIVRIVDSQSQQIPHSLPLDRSNPNAKMIAPNVDNVMKQ